jgi:hypothetical protein
MQEEAKEQLGFHPDVLANVVGCTFKDEDHPGFTRQDHLKAAGGLLSRYGNAGGRLHFPAKVFHDAGNKFDKSAMGIMVPTVDSASGELSVWRQVGFIATRQCHNPECFHSWGGKQKSLLACPKCGHEASDSKSYFNIVVCDLFKEASITELLSTDSEKDDTPIQFGLVWISYGSSGRSLGMRMGYKFKY